MPKYNKSQKGFTNLLSIVGVAFLFLSLVIGTIAISRNNNFDIRNKAYVGESEYLTVIPEITPTNNFQTNTPEPSVYSNPESMGCSPCNCSGVSYCPHGGQLKCVPPNSCSSGKSETGSLNSVPTPKETNDPNINLYCGDCVNGKKSCTNFSGQTSVVSCESVPVDTSKLPVGGLEIETSSTKADILKPGTWFDNWSFLANIFPKSENIGVKNEIANLPSEVKSAKCELYVVSDCRYGCTPTIDGGKCKSAPDSFTPKKVSEEDKTESELVLIEEIKEVPFDIATLKDAKRECSGNYKAGEVVIWGGYVQGCDGKTGKWKNLSAEGYGPEVLTVVPSWLTEDSKTFQNLANLASEAPKYIDKDGVFKEPTKDLWCSTDGGGVPSGTVSVGGVDTRSKCVNGKWTGCSDKPEDVNNYCSLTIIPSYIKNNDGLMADLAADDKIYQENLSKYLNLYENSYSNCSSSGRSDCFNEASDYLTANGIDKGNTELLNSIREEFTSNLALMFIYPDALKQYEKCISIKKAEECLNEKANINKTVATAGIEDILLAETKIQFVSQKYEELVYEYVDLKFKVKSCSANSEGNPNNYSTECKNILNQLSIIENNPIFKYVEAKDKYNQCHSYAECVYLGTQIENFEKDPVFGNIDALKLIADNLVSPSKVFQENVILQDAANAIFMKDDLALKTICLKANNNDQNKCTGSSLNEYKNSVLAQIPEKQKEIYEEYYTQIEENINKQITAVPYSTCSKISDYKYDSPSCSNGYNCLSGFCVPNKGTQIKTEVLTEAEEQEILAEIRLKQNVCSGNLPGSNYDRSKNLCILESDTLPQVISLGREVSNKYNCSVSEYYSEGNCYLKLSDAYDLAVGTNGFGSFIEKYEKKSNACRDEAINNETVACKGDTLTFNSFVFKKDLSLEFDGSNKLDWYGENTSLLFEIAKLEAITDIKGKGHLGEYYLKGEGKVDDSVLIEEGILDQVEEKAWAYLRANVRNTAPNFLGIKLNNDYSIAEKVAVNPSYLEKYAELNNLNFEDLITLNFNPSYKVDSDNNLIALSKLVTVNTVNPGSSLTTGTNIISQSLGNIYNQAQTNYNRQITLKPSEKSWLDSISNPDNPQYIYNEIYGNGVNSISSTLSLTGESIDFSISYSDWVKNDSSRGILFDYASASSFEYGESLKEKPATRFIMVGETIGSVGIGFVASILKPATPAGFAVGTVIEIGGDLVLHGIADALTKSSKEIFLDKINDDRSLDRTVVANTKSSFTNSKINEYLQIVAFDIIGNVVGESIGKAVSGKQIANTFNNSVIFSMGKKVDTEAITNLSDSVWSSSRVLAQNELGEVVEVTSKNEALDFINNNYKNWTIADTTVQANATSLLTNAKNKGMGNVFQSYSEKKIVTNISESLSPDQKIIFDGLNNVNNVLSGSEKSILKTWTDNSKASRSPIEETVSVGEDIKIRGDLYNIKLKNGVLFDSQKAIADGLNITVVKAGKIEFAGTALEYADALKKGTLALSADDLIEVTSGSIANRVVGQEINDTLVDSFTKIDTISYPNYVRFKSGEKVVIGNGSQPFLLADRAPGEVVDVVRNGKLTKSIIGSNGLVSDLKGISSIAINSKKGLRLAAGIDVDTGKFSLGSWLKNGVLADDLPLGRLAKNIESINSIRLTGEVVNDTNNIVLSSTRKLQIVFGGNVVDIPNSGYLRVFDVDGKVLYLTKIKDGAIVPGEFLKKGNFIQVSTNSFTKNLTDSGNYLPSFKQIVGLVEIDDAAVRVKTNLSFSDSINEIFKGKEKKIVATDFDLVKNARANKQLVYEYNVVNVVDPLDANKTGVNKVKFILSDDIDPAVREIIEKRAVEFEGKIDEAIIKYDPVMRESGKSNPLTKVELYRNGTKVEDIIPTDKETPFQFAVRIADRRLKNPDEFIDSKIFTTKGESSFFTWNIKKGGDFVQPDVILDSVLIPGTKIVGADTGLGKSVVAIENIAFLKKELLGPDTKFTIILKNKTDLDSFRKVFSDEAANYLGFKPYVMTEVPPNQLDSSLIEQANVFIGTSDTIFNSLDSSGMGKKMTQAMQGSVLIGDEAHISLRTDVDYIKSVGGNLVIDSSRASRFQELFDPTDGLLGDLTRKHIEEIKINKQSSLIVDILGEEKGREVVIGKAFSKEVRDDAYAKIVRSRLKDFTDVPGIENILKSSNIEESLSIFIKNSDVSDSKLASAIKALKEDISAFNSAQKVFSDVPNNNFGLSTKIFVDEKGVSKQVPAIVPKENNVFTGRQYSSIDDELAYQFLGRKFLGEPIDKISDLNLFVTPDAIGTNYGRFLKDTFNLDESLVLTATPRKISNQWLDRFGISTNFYGSTKNEIPQDILDRLSNNFFSIKNIDDIEVSDVLKAKDGSPSVYVIGANRIDSEKILTRLQRRSTGVGRDIVAIKGSDSVVIYKASGEEFVLDGNYIFKNISGEEIKIAKGLEGIEQLEELYKTNGNNPLDIIYELGRNYGTDLNTLPESKFITFFDNSSDVTDFVQTIGRDRCKGECRNLAAIFLGEENLDLDTFKTLIQKNEFDNLAKIGVSDIDGEIRNAGYRFIQELQRLDGERELGDLLKGENSYDDILKKWRSTSDLDTSIGFKGLTPEEHIAEQTNRLQSFINELSYDASFRKGLSNKATDFLDRSRGPLFKASDVVFKDIVDVDTISPLSDALNARQLILNINSTYSKDKLPELIAGKSLSSGQVKVLGDVQENIQQATTQKASSKNLQTILEENIKKLSNNLNKVNNIPFNVLKPKTWVSGIVSGYRAITKPIASIIQKNQSQVENQAKPVVQDTKVATNKITVNKKGSNIGLSNLPSRKEIGDKAKVVLNGAIKFTTNVFSNIAKKKETSISTTNEPKVVDKKVVIDTKEAEKTLGKIDNINKNISIPVEKIELHNSSFGNRKLTANNLYSKGLQPKYSLNLEGKQILLSDPYEIKGGRIAFVVYVKADNSDNYIARSYYRSNSSSSWRYLPGYEIREDGGTWYSKGFGEEGINATASLQEFMSNIIVEVKPLKLTDYEFIFMGLATPRKYSSTYYFEVGENPELVNLNERYTSGKTLPMPDYLRTISLGDEPDFSKQLSSWIENTSLYGKVAKDAFPSKNGKYVYVFYRDTLGRAGIAFIENQSKITSHGIRQNWISAGALLTPIMEYSSQSGGYGNYEIASGSYIDMYKNYLSKVPVIKEYQDYIKKNVLKNTPVVKQTTQTTQQKTKTNVFKNIGKILLTTTSIGVALTILLGNSFMTPKIEASIVQPAAIVSEINEQKVFSANNVSNINFSSKGQVSYVFEYYDPYKLVPDYYYNSILPKIINSQNLCNSTNPCESKLSQLPIVSHINNKSKISSNFEQGLSFEKLDEKFIWFPTINWSSQASVRQDTKENVEAFLNEAISLKSSEYFVKVKYGYRSYGEQEYAYRKQTTGDVAKPGYSQHQTGLAIDLDTNIPYSVLVDVANKHGFVHPFSLESGWSDPPHWFYLDGIYPGLTQMIIDAGKNPNDINVINEVLLGLSQTYEARIAWFKEGQFPSQQNIEEIDNVNQQEQKAPVEKEIINQHDSRWANIKIGDDVTMSNVGCGIASVAYIVQKTPIEIMSLYPSLSEDGTDTQNNANALRKLGYEVELGNDNNGALQGKIKWANEHKDYRELYSSINTFLKQGWEVMLNGNFANLKYRGHWVVVTAVDLENSTITVVDSNLGKEHKYSFGIGGKNSVDPKRILLAKKPDSQLAYMNSSIIPFLTAETFEKLSEKYIYSEWPEAKEKGILPVLYQNIKKFLETKKKNKLIIPVTGTQEKIQKKIINVNGEEIEASVIGIKNPTSVDIDNLKEDDFILYHGSFKPLEINVDYKHEDDSDEPDGSVTLGTGVYSTDDKNQAQLYAKIRANIDQYPDYPQGYLSVLIPNKAVMLDLRGNKPIPEPIFKAWVSYWNSVQPKIDSKLKKELSTYSLSYIAIKDANDEYTNFLEKIKDIKNDPNKRNIRYVLGTMDIPEYGISTYQDSNIEYFRNFMLSLGFDGIIAPEGGDSEEFGYSDSYIFYNYDKVGTMKDWENKTNKGIKFLGSGFNWPESARIWREAQSKAKNNIVKKIFGFSGSVAEFIEDGVINKLLNSNSFEISIPSNKLFTELGFYYYKLTGKVIVENLGAFNASTEIKKLWDTKPNSQERKDAIAKYKEQYASQQKGISELKVEIKNIIKDNPGIKKSELLSVFRKYSAKYLLPYRYEINMLQFIKDYEKVRNNLNELKKDYKDIGKLYKDFFGKSPIGGVKVTYQPLNIIFTVSNDEDYVYLHDSKHDGKEVVDIENKKEALASAGFKDMKIINSKEYFYTVIRKDKDNYSDIIHEERHTINELLDLCMIFTPIVEVPKNIEITQEVLLGYVDEVEEFVMEQTKNEVLAYISDGTTLQDIMIILAANKSEGGIYDYYQEYRGDGKGKKILFEFLSKKQKKQAEVIWESLIATPEQIQKREEIIEYALEAYISLINKGINSQEALALLEEEPLYKWPRVANRIDPLFEKEYEGNKAKFVDYLSQINWKGINIYDLYLGDFDDYFLKEKQDFFEEDIDKFLNDLIPQISSLPMDKAINLLRIEAIFDYYNGLDAWNNADITEFLDRTTFIKNMIENIDENNIELNNTSYIFGPVGKRYTVPFAWVSSGFNSQQVHLS